jgi:hypothetical protein
VEFGPGFGDNTGEEQLFKNAAKDLGERDGTGVVNVRLLGIFGKEVNTRSVPAGGGGSSVPAEMEQGFKIESEG